MSLFSGITKLILGGAEVAAGALIAVGTLGGGTPLAAMLIASGAGMMLSGAGTLIQGSTVQARSTTQRNPTAPWPICYGRVATGGKLVYEHEWGGDTPTLDMVIVLDAHSSQSVDELLFDQQRIQLDPTGIPTLGGVPPLAGSGTSFSPAQQTVNITSIVRSNNVVTVTLPANIPYLTAGDQIQIKNVTGDLTLNGKFQVAQIISQVFGSPGSIVFTYLSGGVPVSITGQGQAATLWADYGRNVYMEVLTEQQVLGFTFIGMMVGTPFQGSRVSGGVGTLVSPSSPGPAGGVASPNPWTGFCSLQGKTAVFLRIYLAPKYFPSGLPLISFRMHGKNDIYDPRLGPLSGIKGGGFSNAGSGYHVYDVLGISQSGASGAQIQVTSITSSGAILTWVVTAVGTGYSVASGLSATGGAGSGAVFDLTVLTGATGCNVYTENPALCIADYLANTDYGFKAVYGSDIPIAPLIASANICDTAVPLAAGGTEPMYTLNGQFELSMLRGEVLQNMLTSCAGRMLPEAPFTIQPGYWVGPGSPPVSVNLQSIAAGPIRWKYLSIRDLYNGCKGTYISPNNKWQPTDFPPYAQDAMHGYSGPAQFGGDVNLAADNNERRWLELHLPFTLSASTAQRIAKIELLRRRWAGSRQFQGTGTVQIGGSGTFQLNMAGYQFLTLDVFEATVPVLSMAGQLLEVQDVRLRCEAKPGSAGESVAAPLLGVELDVQATDSSIYAWSTSEELSAQGYVQTTLPQGEVQETVCWPWSPGYVAPLAGDAVYPEGATGPASFGLQPVYENDAQGNVTAALQIKGYAPINALDTSIENPEMSCVYSATPGSLPAGTYVLALSARDSGASNYAASGYLNLCTVEVGANGSIDCTIFWGSGDDGGDLYMALWTADGYVFHHQQAVATGATSVNIGTFDQSTPGGPDTIFDHFGVPWQEVIHFGLWAQQVQAVTPTTITIAGSGMTANLWAGYTLTLLGKYDPTQEIAILNMPVASSTASSSGLFILTIGPNSASVQLPDLTTLLEVGDLVALPGNYVFTANSFSDPNVANPYYPSGDTGVEAGHVAVVLSGADTGDVQTIASVTGTPYPVTFNLAGSWKITPTTGDLIAICAPASAPEIASAAMRARNGSVVGVMAQPDVSNMGEQTWLFRVRTEDVNGNAGPDSLAPMRVVYLFGGGGTQTITADVTSADYR